MEMNGLELSNLVWMFKKNDLKNLFMNQEIQNIEELVNSLFVVQ